MARYTPDELEQWWFVPTIADQATPSPTEVNAGEEITDAVVSISGFKYTGTKVETPDLGSRFNSSIPGRYSAEDCNIQFYRGDASGDIEQVVEDLLPDDTAGFIVIIPPEDGAKQAVANLSTCQVWPVKVMSNTWDPPVPGESKKFTVDFSIPKVPSKAGVITT